MSPRFHPTRRGGYVKLEQETIKEFSAIERRVTRFCAYFFYTKRVVSPDDFTEPSFRRRGENPPQGRESVTPTKPLFLPNPSGPSQPREHSVEEDPASHSKEPPASDRPALPSVTTRSDRPRIPSREGGDSPLTHKRKELAESYRQQQTASWGYRAKILFTTVATLIRQASKWGLIALNRCIQKLPLHWRIAAWAGIAVASLIAVGLLLGGTKRIVTRKPPPVKKADALRTRHASTATFLAQQRDRLDQVDAITVQSPQLKLTAELVQAGVNKNEVQGPTLLLKTTGQSLQGTDHTGRIWREVQRCWQSEGRGRIPSVETLLLPFGEPSVRFGKLEQTEDVQRVPYSARRLGAWGPGQGEILVEGDTFTRFSYRPRNAQVFDFTVSYPNDFSPATFSPLCS